MWLLLTAGFQLHLLISADSVCKASPYYGIVLIAYIPMLVNTYFCNSIIYILYTAVSLSESDMISQNKISGEYIAASLITGDINVS